MPGDDQRTGEPGDESTGDDSTSGGDKGEGDTTDPEEPPVDNGSEDATPESGGSKGEDPADEPDVEEPAPDPNSTPGVMLPPATRAPSPGPGRLRAADARREGVTPYWRRPRH